MTHHDHNLIWDEWLGIFRCVGCPATFASEFVIPYNQPQPLIEAIEAMFDESIPEPERESNG